jgi:hypothetical protein
MNLRISGKTILIAPSDWGLGHSSRCVPLIRQLSKNNVVILGTTSLNEPYFDSLFSHLEKIPLPRYGIRYSRWLPAWLKMLLKSPWILRTIIIERHALSKIVASRGIEIVISDCRFGLHNAGTHNIFITHQLKLLTPGRRLARRINEAFIHKFSEVWVPDYAEQADRISGRLSDPGNIRIPVTFIGPQSALTCSERVTGVVSDILILLSGPEPQRSLLERKLAETIPESAKTIFVLGKVGTEVKTGNAEKIEFASGEKLAGLILGSSVVICRSGYSTLMDLHLLGKKKMILIPTPGQPEQEYLAAYWNDKFNASVLKQGKITKENLMNLLDRLNDQV